MPNSNTPDFNLGDTFLVGKPGKPEEPKPVQPKQAPLVALITGSNVDFSKENSNLLRVRLRLASLILSCGYTAFLLKALLVPSGTGSVFANPQFWLLLGVTALTAFLSHRLYLNCNYALRHLRVVEFLIFSSSAFFFVFLGLSTLIRSAEQGYLPPIVTPWMILMFTYALFIPSTWQRALAVLLPMTIAPIGVHLFASIYSPAVRNLINSNPDFQHIYLETTMVMTLATTIAVWGVWTIRSLRSQAFEARQLGQYRLKRLLGRGGMGEVHLAEHMMLKRPCAIKLIRPEMAGDPSTLARFEREVQSTARLTHWNTVEIFDYGRAADGTFYYVMEYLPGLSLDRIVDMHGAMPPGRIIHLLSQTCDALAEAHCQKMIHRDIKPGNLFAAKQGGTFDVAKLLDFGLVRTDPAQSAKDLQLTQEGTVTGSPLYLSPEQAIGEPADERSDIYSIGCVAYFLLTGRPPFQEDKAIKLILAHAQQRPELPSNFMRNVPADLESIVLRCLEKDPKDRFQAVRDLREALLECKNAGEWTRDDAQEWWASHGCPEKRELDECVIDGRELAPLSEEEPVHEVVHKAFANA